VTPVPVLVVDDEKPARERVRRLLLRDARVVVAGVCSGGAEAVSAIIDASSRHEPVQVLCLDVQMPEVDGFGVLGRLVDLAGVVMPAVIFVTAHDEFAVRAFESQAVDYLLKPFSDERFQAALDRALASVRTRGAVALLAEMQALLEKTTTSTPRTDGSGPTTRQPLDRIVLKGAHRVRLLPVEQIVWIEAEGMYVNIHTRDGAAHLHRGLIGALEESLDPRRFIRIHRSAIINIDLVRELRQNAHGDYIAVLHGGIDVPVGRSFRAKLQTRLGQAL